MRIYSKEGYAPFRDYVTWYRVTGDPQSKKPPVVLLHGGPGAAHDYLDSYKLLARNGRQVIHYDQLGCGKSTLLPDKGVDFWTPQLFVEELNSLIDFLGLRSAYHDTWAFSWVPPLGYKPLSEDPKGWFLTLVIPWITLSILYIGLYGRVLRANLIEAMQEDYIRTARAKGL